MQLLNTLKRLQSQKNAVKFRGLNVNISSIWHRNKNDVNVPSLQLVQYIEEQKESNERIMNRFEYSCEYDE